MKNSKVQIKVKSHDHASEIKDLLTEMGGRNATEKWQNANHGYYYIRDTSKNIMWSKEYVEEYREIFTEEAVPEVEAEPLTFPRKMLCWDSNENFSMEDTVFGIFNEVDHEYKVVGKYNYWKHAKEIPSEPKIEDMTLSEVCKALGKKIRVVEG